jgi:hypothetical protein
VCYEPVAGKSGAEFRRKTRVITRGLRGVFEMRSLLNPFRFGFYSLQLLSHKVVRRLVAVPVVLLALITPWLWSSGLLYQAAAVGQGLFYAAALIGLVCSKRGFRPPRVCLVAFYFSMVNAAALVAVANVLRGRRIELWNPQRGAYSQPPDDAKQATQIVSAPLQETMR